MRTFKRRGLTWSWRGRLVAGSLLAAVGVVAFAFAGPVAPQLLERQGEDWCEEIRASFERTGRWARELATALESLDAEGATTTATRLGAVRQGLKQEGELLQTKRPPAGGEAVQTHGAAAVELLLALADPTLLDNVEADRDGAITFVRDQFLAAKGEARAASAALRSGETACGKNAGGGFRLLGRSDGR